MKVFTHGTVINFQESAREMFVCDLEKLIHTYQNDEKQLLLGSVHLEKGELHLFGRLQRWVCDEQMNRWEWHFILMNGEERLAEHAISEIAMSHDATFDVIDPTNNQIRYQVIYVTFREKNKEEITYFLAAEDKVSEPLAYVAKFWEHVHEVGKNADFTLSGCRAKVFCKK